MHVKVELNFGEQKFLPYECMYVCERELSLKSKIRMQIIAGDANSMMHSWRVQFICKLLCIFNSSSNRSPPCTICIYCLKLHKLISFDSAQAVRARKYGTMKTILLRRQVTYKYQCFINASW
jgi:hypothetical protein